MVIKNDSDKYITGKPKNLHFSRPKFIETQKYPLRRKNYFPIPEIPIQEALSALAKKQDRAVRSADSDTRVQERRHRTGGEHETPLVPKDGCLRRLYGTRRTKESFRGGMNNAVTEFLREASSPSACSAGNLRGGSSQKSPFSGSMPWERTLSHDALLIMKDHSRKSRSFLLRLGWRSFLSALASIWRMRSRVTPKRRPTSSSV